MKTFDAIIIGAGQAGPPLAKRLASAGMTVALVERKLVGGTCVNTGCMPTKTLVASARAAHVARRCADFGVVLAPGIDIDMKRVKARVDRVVLDARAGLESMLEGLRSCTFVRGHARLESATAVRVNDELLSSNRIFIDVGGRAIVPKNAIDVPHFTNESILSLDVVPEHLVIVGGGYVGLEIGQIHRRLGAMVTILEKGPRLLSREDEDASDGIRRILEEEGIAFCLDAECFAYERAGSGIRVRFECKKLTEAIVGSHLLLAIGRAPNTSDLGLERAGVATDARGYIVVDDTLRTTAPGIWALGECNGHGAFTHTAYDDFEIVAANLLGDEPRRLSDRFTEYAVYVDPPLGRCGATEAELRASHRPFRVGKRPMTRVSRAVERAETRGFMKILVDEESKRIAGASILGIEGDEVVQAIAYFMRTGAPYTTLQRSMGIHPTVAELVPTVLGELR